jgi:hypothetical protein
MKKIDIAKLVYKRSIKWINEIELLTDETLCGMCGICSVSLTESFINFGFFNTYAMMGKWFGKNCTLYGIDHCWVESDGEIWDITVRQFDLSLPKIFVIKSSDEKASWYRDGLEIDRETFPDDWPDEQRPSYKTKGLTVSELHLTKVSCR